MNTDNDIIMITLYAHPAHSPYYKAYGNENTLDKLDEFVGELVEVNEWEDILILADTNGRVSDWNPCIKASSDLPDNTDGEREIVYERSSKDSIINNFGKKTN